LAHAIWFIAILSKALKTFPKMHFLSAASLILALRTLSSRAMPSPQDTSPGDSYVPLNIYEAFESPPPEETLLTLASDLNIQPAGLYYLSVFYTYNILSVSEKADLTAQRELNKTNDEVNLYMWAIPGDCRPLWINGHREIHHGWGFERKNGEKDYD
jgi:hypothetical protein